MVTDRTTRARPAPALIIVVVFAVAVRAALGGPAPASSAPAAIVFSLILMGAVTWGGWHVTHVHWTGVAIGGAGAVGLVALSLRGLPAVHVGANATASVLLWWMPLVTVVAATEELVLRGVLFDALRRRSGDAFAVTVTALLFAAIHLPLYGMPALGIDLCVGIFLGCLRVASGGVTAPLVAHVLADLATGWVG